MLSFNRYQQKYPLKMAYDFKLPQMGYESNCFFIPSPKWALSNFKSVYNLRNKNYIGDIVLVSISFKTMKV